MLKTWRIKQNMVFHSLKLSLLSLTQIELSPVMGHSDEEARFYCFGRLGEGIVTVRFTYRDKVIRIFGAGYWRKGKRIYERENEIHG